MLQQPWYDDLSKPESSKFKILTGNVEQAVSLMY